MPLVDDDVIIPGTGFLYIGPPGTPKPASLSAPASPWDNLGHTSRDDGLTISRDGGDSNVLGTWQNPSLRNRRDPTTYAVTAFLHQVNNTNFELYFGSGDVSVTGEFGVPNAPAPTEKALYVRIVDGATAVGLYIPKVSVAADDDITVDVEGFLTFPVRATVLAVTGSNLMTFLRSGLGAG